MSAAAAVTSPNSVLATPSASPEFPKAVIEFLIAKGIREMNTGTNGTARQSITADNLSNFLKSPRGLALIFWAMNEVYSKGEDLFRVTIDEWRVDRPKALLKGAFIFDCHTHYIQRPNATHTGPQYRRGARGNWWMFPESWKLRFESNGQTVIPVNESDIRLDQLHRRDKFKDFMLRAHSTYGKNFCFLISPAPYTDYVDMNGSASDLASYEDMQRTCDEINIDKSVGRPICLPLAVIMENDSALSRGASDHPSRVWKIYPASGNNWDEGGRYGKAWLRTNLKIALQQLEEEAKRSSKMHAVCIHWWDGADAPTKKDIGEVADNHPNLNFVIYHACYPHYQELSDLLTARKNLARKNLFVEIGGTFANQILGSDGGDGAPDNPDKTLRGPEAAKVMLASLRGQLTRGVGVNDSKIVWGTDSIWHGSPIWQIEAFKRLRLTDNRHQDDAFKRKVLGRNALQAFSVATDLRQRSVG